MSVRALCTFGCSRRPVTQERAILAIADEFRRELCQCYWDHHRATIDLRNESFPDLYAALVDRAAVKAKIHMIECFIKAHHSEVRDRNAVTDEQREALENAREARAAAELALKRPTQAWKMTHTAFTAWWQAQADWKQVKSLAKRTTMYAEIQLPTIRDPYLAVLTERENERAAKAGEAPKPIDADLIMPDIIATYGKLYVEHDLRRRSLDQRFARQLHSAIRSEIVAASKPKVGRDGPGMRYVYHRPPDPKPWQKLTIQFPGGLSFAAALANRNNGLQLTPWNPGDTHRYKVRQQIGTAATPCLVEYELRADRPIPPDAIFKRWSMLIREDDAREVVPIIGNLNEPKPTGSGVLAYRLSWTVRKSGIEVAHFWGDHVNERLIIPQHIMELRMAVKHQQLACDTLANELLASLGCLPLTGERQGVAALETYVQQHPENTAAGNRLDQYLSRLQRARRTMQRAVGCIEKIYETVVHRVCQLHSEIVQSDLNLAKIKRYDTRDLLREDVLPMKSREILAAVAPGKLKALLNNYGLMKCTTVPSDQTPPTDLFSTYVGGIGGRYGSRKSLVGHE